MSLRPHLIDPVPEPTARVAHAAFPKGSLAIRHARSVVIVTYLQQHRKQVAAVRSFRPPVVNQAVHDAVQVTHRTTESHVGRNGHSIGYAVILEGGLGARRRPASAGQRL